VMNCCKNTADNGIWFPILNDCHNPLEKCIKDAGLVSPGAPGGRLGKRCDGDSCPDQ
jgi:hypothetical protein